LYLSSIPVWLMSSLRNVRIDRPYFSSENSVPCTFHEGLYKFLAVTRLPFDDLPTLHVYNFTLYFTSLSRCLSTFLHSTCPLSVSQFIFSFTRHIPGLFRLKYRSTLLSCIFALSSSFLIIGLSPTLVPTFLKVLQVRIRLPSYAHNSRRIQVKLFPFRSPLLGESLLISFPQPTNMLKFSR